MMHKLIIIMLIAFQHAFCIEENDVNYFLYSSTNKSDPIKLSLGHFKSGKGLNLIDLKNTVKFFCHGYRDGPLNEWVKASKDALFEKNDINIISVDWSGPSNNDFYPICVENVPIVAEYVAKFIIEIHETFGIPYNKFYLIGHSLGAHVTGFTGKKIFKLTKQKIGRITGLDPAGPLFLFTPTRSRLSEHDALFVDAIHTDAMLQGYYTNLAHADFWPNGGILQPGCNYFSACAHTRAPFYFSESILNNVFLARKCDSINDYNNGKCNSNKMEYMGYYCSTTARGNFYLRTNDKYPYALKANQQPTKIN